MSEKGTRLGWRAEAQKRIRKGNKVEGKDKKKEGRKETHRASTAKYEERERERGPIRR
jgi:hypothetical protein